jgi:hypothetical protein
MTYELELEVLNNKLKDTEGFIERMEIMDEILNLKVKYNLIQTPSINEPIECIGCGS